MYLVPYTKVMVAVKQARRWKRCASCGQDDQNPRKMKCDHCQVNTTGNMLTMGKSTKEVFVSLGHSVDNRSANSSNQHMKM